MRQLRWSRLALPALLLLIGCTSPDPVQEFEMLDLETYWAVGTPRGGTQYLSPVVRFRLRHKGQEAHRSVQATAAFRRQGEEETWGSGWARVNPQGELFAPGEVHEVVMISDARYTSNGPIEGMLAHPEFVDTNVDVFIRAGSSQWTRFAQLPVERRLGSRTVITAEPSPSTEPEPQVEGNDGTTDAG